MAKSKRVNVKAILADPDLRRQLMVSTIQATQAREGIETTEEQADRAYYVVSEGERAAFFALEQFRAGNRYEVDRRHEMLVRSLAGTTERVRSDVARRDFAAIEGSPLAYQRVGIVAHLFRDHPATETLAEAYQGVITRSDEPFLRYFWEISPKRDDRPWVPLHKGGDFSRFYYNADLVIDWSDAAKSAFHRLREPKIYFKSGLTWPRRTQKGFNLRRLPAGCVFSDKGPSIFFHNPDNEKLFFAIANSRLAEYIMQTLTSFGSWELTAVRRFPFACNGSPASRRLAEAATTIHDAKAVWDKGNEVSTRFCTPWLLRSDVHAGASRLGTRLDSLVIQESNEESKMRETYAELNDEVYCLYGIPDTTRANIEATLGERPPEILWPQMEGKTVEQKRMEHVWRLLSYAVKRVVEADEDGIVPFAPVSGETNLLDRIHQELAQLFPEQDVNQVEVEITNELKRKVKSYKRASSIGEWLDNIYFDYHASLYKSRPIIWHIASSQSSSPFAFGTLCHYHKLDKNRMAKLRASYLRDAIEAFRREAALADQAGRNEDRVEWQAKLEEAQALDRSLQAVQEGHHEGAEGGDRDYRILTPWKSQETRPKGWDPDIDDGVKVNIEPLQKAGVLRIAMVV